jgi:ADP-heptose:LPS heptosyltransferase
MKGARILLIRLGAMGDVIHALPAAATVKASFPDAHLAWCIDRKWSVLLAGNRCLDEVVAFDRKHVRELLSTASRLRAAKFDIAIDVQGLMKSAVLARITGAETRYGFHHTQAREGLAAWLYSNPVRTSSKHVVDQNLEIVRGAGARETSLMFPLPPGRAEGTGAECAARNSSHRRRAHPHVEHRRLDSRDSCCYGGRGHGQRTSASGGSPREARCRDLWTHGS